LKERLTEFPYRAWVETLDAGPVGVTVYAIHRECPERILARGHAGPFATIKRDDRKRKMTLPAKFVRALPIP
jgi:hypothetical protein